MSLFCEQEDLATESDVEQKLIWNLLTLAHPVGPGFLPADIKTKPDIRKIEIGKGAERKVYFPDYIVVLSGLPVLIVEAKAPDEDIAVAAREARLYATEINSRFGADINPCSHTMASNGALTRIHAWDSDAILCEISLDQMIPTNPHFAQMVGLIGRVTLEGSARALLARTVGREYFRPINLAGGASVRNEELGHNSFGANLVLNYRHLFNPTTRTDRAFIVNNAYIGSTRRERYVQEIDKIIRVAAPPSISNAKPIENTESPKELTDWFTNRAQLEHQVLLLIGAVGSGKTTFVDYLQEVALPEELKKVTAWVHVDMNTAPVNKEHIYDWLTEKIIEGLQGELPDVDFASMETIRKIYYQAIGRLERGPLSLIKSDPAAYNLRLADELLKLQQDRSETAKAVERFVCTDRAKLLVIALDNCDKRARDEQLLMFQVAQWVQNTFRCLVILPLRDITYDLHRHEPPLDTALKDLVFRIEPPSFQKVLEARIKLAIVHMHEAAQTKSQSFGIGQQIRVEYPTEKLGMYLSSIVRSLYEYDAFARKIITGIAGRDIRRAMEIFLEFCNSGYIDEAEIFKIIQSNGSYNLPYFVVIRVLLRMNYRFYDGDHSYVKNLFQSAPADARPDHFVRLSILDWLFQMRLKEGPIGVRGYHKASALLADLTSHGHDSDRLQSEMLYLVKAMCVVPEHQVQDRLSMDDLITLGPAGYVHLDLVTNLDYLASCAEDTWFNDGRRASAITQRIAARGLKGHFSRATGLENARELMEYLQHRTADILPRTSEFLNDHAIPIDSLFGEVQRKLHRGFASLESRRTF